jgi:hypothetical protein
VIDFSRYMKEKEPGKGHAALSASGSERWLGCPGSVNLCKDLPQVDNEYSITGTKAHTLLQFILENYRGHWELLHSQAAKDFRAFIDYSDDQYRAVLVAVKFVREQQQRTLGPFGETHIEKKVHLKGVGFGTADIILYQPFGVLHVMDYKNGRSVVEPEENTQGLYYAYAAADLCGWDFSEVWITIIQPNAPHRKGPIRTWKTSEKRLEKAGMMFRVGAKKARQPNAPLVTNDKWCWWCPARQVCPEQMKGKHERIAERFFALKRRKV